MRTVRVCALEIWPLDRNLVLAPGRCPSGYQAATEHKMMFRLRSLRINGNEL